MAEDILKQCVLRLKSAEILPSIRRWSYLGLRDLKQLEQKLCFKKTKGSLANQILEHCQEKGGLTLESAGELDLIYVQQNAAKKIWNAYMFTDPREKRSLCETPAQMKRKMTKYLRLYFQKDCSVTTMLHNGLLWGRVYIPKKGVKSYQSTRCLYFIHYPQTQVIIINGMKSSYSQFIKQCFVGAFGFKDITDMSLTGHHQESLAELAINKHSEGGFTRFQRERRSGPLEEISSRKRKAPEEIQDDRIVDENSAEKRLRLETLEHAFGENVQPTLEKIEYRVELPYRGRDVAEELKSSTELFMSKVTFQGSSVLEGLRNLAEHGYTSIPLPKHLTCVPTRARNYFLLSKAKKDTDSTNISLSKTQRANKETNESQSNTSVMQRGVLKEISTKPTRTSPRKHKK